MPTDRAEKIKEHFSYGHNMYAEWIDLTYETDWVYWQDTFGWSFERGFYKDNIVFVHENTYNIGFMNVIICHIQI